MTGDQCPSCGHRLTAVLGAGGAAHCPRCGDPLPVSADGATVTHQPEAAPPTVAPGEATAAHDPGPAAPAPRLPSVPGYELLEVIGRGGMGVVYKAHQLAPRRVGALKMILGTGGGRADRFRSEIAAVARLQHPNVVQIHEVGEAGGRGFFSMEYVPGGSLAARLGDGPLPTREAAELVRTLARAVQHAHDRQIVHRDLKPANILLSNAERGTRNAELKPGAEGGAESYDSAFRTPHSSLHPKIADFGLAKHLEGSADGSGPMTQSGAILGTPNYMAPEQAKGKSKLIGPATDIWALGAILYECLTGRPPFREDSHLDTMMKVISEDPEPPRQRRSAVPRDLETICLKCLRKEPTERYATAGDLADDLERFLDGRPIQARSRTLRERVAGWARRRREYLFLAAGAALIAGLAVIALDWGAGWKRGPVPDPTAQLPADLRLVPPDALGFATVRVADLWANPATRDLFDTVAARDPAVKFDGTAAEIEAQTSIHPTHIERATFVLPAENSPDGPLIILATTGPYSHDRLGEMLAKRERHQPQDAGGRRMYVPTRPHDFAYLAFSDRILVMGEIDR